MSKELGARYVLEGSVQRVVDRVRISVQLIDALSGDHVWAERYDQDPKDILAVQDEITLKVLMGVVISLEGGNVSKAEKYALKHYRGKQGVDCYWRLTEAIGYYQRWNIPDINLARRKIEEVIALCPENPYGYLHLGWVYHHDYALGNTKSPRETFEKGIELAQKALSLENSLHGPHALLCALSTVRLRISKGTKSLVQTIA